MINKRLEEIVLTINSKTLRDASSHALFPSGKRIRPLMLLSISGNKGLDIAAAIELIHTYTLIHDDLPSMDNDSLRRGVPTIHKAFGEATAILTGDLLLTLSFEVIANSDLPPPLLIKIIRNISSNIGPNGLILGQLLDIEAKSKGLNEEEHNYISSRKTSDLFTTSLVCGALIADLSDSEIERYAQFGQIFGLLYQLKDDLEDHNSPIPLEKQIKLKEKLTANAYELLRSMRPHNDYLFQQVLATSQCLN